MPHGGDSRGVVGEGERGFFWVLGNLTLRQLDLARGYDPGYGGAIYVFPLGALVMDACVARGNVASQSVR